MVPVARGPPTVDVMDTPSAWGRALALSAAATFVGAVVVFVTAVVWTDAVYGTRVAWFLGVVVPLLALTAGLSWLASRPQPAQEDRDARTAGTRPCRARATTGLFGVSLLLLAIPAALAAMLLLVDGVLIVLHHR